jgi:hypothetical protein
MNADLARRGEPHSMQMADQLRLAGAAGTFVSPFLLSRPRAEVAI